MAAQKTPKAGDGRRLRTERSRQEIVDAALALVQEGVLVPTAQQVADQTGLTLRTVFRHFNDMESLYETIDEAQREHYEALFVGGDRSGSFAERIEHAVERHGAAYDAVESKVMSHYAQRWRYETLRKNYARNQRGLRKDLNDWLPELNAVSVTTREAVDAVASFEMWYRLREHQGLSHKASVALISSMLKSILLDDNPRFT